MKVAGIDLGVRYLAAVVIYGDYFYAFVMDGRYLPRSVYKGFINRKASNMLTNAADAVAKLCSLHNVKRVAIGKTVLQIDKPVIKAIRLFSDALVERLQQSGIEVNFVNEAYTSAIPWTLRTKEIKQSFRYHRDAVYDPITNRVFRSDVNAALNILLNHFRISVEPHEDILQQLEYPKHFIVLGRYPFVVPPPYKAFQVFSRNLGI